MLAAVLAKDPDLQPWVVVFAVHMCILNSELLPREAYIVTRRCGSRTNIEQKKTKTTSCAYPKCSKLREKHV